MNNIYNPPKEIEIDLKDLFWKLLMQWKAILLVCIAMALLVTGVKYARDTKAYNAALEDKKIAEEPASKPVDERIESALELLPAKDRQAVMYCVHLQETADLQQKYLDRSILMNTDPANQRTLTLNYLIKSDSGVSMRTLVDYYNAGLRNDDLMKNLREVIDPDADLEYIYELVNNYDKQFTKPEYTDSDSVIYSVSVVIPEETDAETVTGLIDSEIGRLHNNLNTYIGTHGIQKIAAEDTHVFNKYAVERKTGILNNLNNINNNIKNLKSSLSPEQQAAAESIIAIKQSSEEAEDNLDADDIQEPGFSKKYALLGFILGAFLYAGIYVMMLILKKIVASASTAQSYTGTRLLAEVYLKSEHKGLRWLFTSDIVAKLRYKDKLDADKQITSLAATADAICAHYGTDKLTLLLSGVDVSFDRIVDRIVRACSSEGNRKSIDLINADEMNEKALSAVKNAVYVISSMTRVDGLCQLMSLCKDYDVTALGSIYLEEL